MSVEIAKNRRQKDYSNGKIYIIRNSINDMTYIGSTCQTLAQRMAQHRQDMNNERRQKYRLYQAMSEHGKDAFFIELLETYPCQTKDELLKKEGEKIREYRSELNKIITGRSKKEYYQDNAEQINHKQKVIYERNKEHILNYQNEYRSNNKDILKSKRLQYYQKNKERIAEKRKTYLQQNKEKIAERRKQRRMEKKRVNDSDILI